MGDVVHYTVDDMGGNPHTLCDNPGSFGVLTIIEKLVNCPDCLEKLKFVEPVDEEKVKIAEALVKECLDQYGGCPHCSKWVENHIHDIDCVIRKAEAYLKSVKGE